MGVRSGFFQVKVNGVLYDFKGDAEVGYGQPLRKPIFNSLGANVGFNEEPQVPYLQGKVTDRGDFDVIKMLNITGATVTYQKANGKTAVLHDAYFAGPGTENSKEAELDFRFEGARMEET